MTYSFRTRAFDMKNSTRNSGYAMMRVKYGEHAGASMNYACNVGAPRRKITCFTYKYGRLVCSSVKKCKSEEIRTPEICFFFEKNIIIENIIALLAPPRSA